MAIPIAFAIEVLIYCACKYGADRSFPSLSTVYRYSWYEYY